MKKVSNEIMDDKLGEKASVNENAKKRKVKRERVKKDQVSNEKSENKKVSRRKKMPSEQNVQVIPIIDDIPVTQDMPEIPEVPPMIQDMPAVPDTSAMPEIPLVDESMFEDREGVFELVQDQGFGFVRSAEFNFLASDDDCYMAVPEVKRYRLKTGDYVKVQIDKSRQSRYAAVSHVYSINFKKPEEVRTRVPFERLVPIFPNEKFNLIDDKHLGENLSNRIVDLFSPIGKGQRGLIVAQPKTGKTMLLKSIANAIKKHNPEVYMIILLIDERPEEVTDMKRAVKDTVVVSSTFDESAEHHIKVSQMVYEHSRRMVECGHDVVILMDSLTRLARAYNTVEPSSGKVLSGGVDPRALYRPKQFFGAARNVENGGSLTIIATALIETGSKMDDFIFEEFKGTGNMELQLNRILANRRIFPAVDLAASSTRRDDLLLPPLTLKNMWGLRSMLSTMNPAEAMNLVLQQMDLYKTNEKFIENINKG